ncbi:hypothetical protein E4T68_04615 [Granulicatella sp. WM01]|nr:hypothetical protein E4T68_04615 [Granulicatella sp. WM01]
MITEEINQNFVKELDNRWIIIRYNQHFYEYTLFLCKEYYTELLHLPSLNKLKLKNVIYY